MQMIQAAGVDKDLRWDPEQHSKAGSDGLNSSVTISACAGVVPDSVPCRSSRIEISRLGQIVAPY